MLFKRKPKSNAISIPEISDIDKALNTIQKINGMYNAQMGIGDYQSDPIESMTVIENPMFGTSARLINRNLDLMQRIIEGPVNDSLKNGYEITTNFDDIGISDLLNEHCEDLKFEDALRQFGINTRLYSKGGLIFPVLREYDECEPSQPLNFYNLEKIEALNVVYEEHITYTAQNSNPLVKDYGNINNLWLLGKPIHKSRYYLHVTSFDPFLYRGISILDRVKRAVYGINIAQWTVTELLKRYRVLTFTMDPKNLMQMTVEQKNSSTSVLNLIAKWATSKSVVPIPAGGEFSYIQSSLTDIDKAIDTLYDFLAAVTEIPQSKIRGSAQGELASADANERQYHEMLESKMHKMTFKPAMQYLFKMMIHERRGEIFKTLWKNNIDPDSVTVDIKFNPIASVNPMSEAQINLIKSQTDATDIQSGVRSADMARKERFPEMAQEVVPESDFDAPEPVPDNINAMEKIQRLKASIGIN